MTSQYLLYAVQDCCTHCMLILLLLLVLLNVRLVIHQRQSSHASMRRITLR